MSKIGLMDLMTGAITAMNLIGLSIQRQIVTKIVSIFYGIECIKILGKWALRTK
jgi:hypothetical protein